MSDTRDDKTTPRNDKNQDDDEEDTPLIDKNKSPRETTVPDDSEAKPDSTGIHAEREEKNTHGMKRSLRARKRDKDKAEDAESLDDKGVAQDTHDLADNDATEEDGLLNRRADRKPAREAHTQDKDHPKSPEKDKPASDQTSAPPASESTRARAPPNESCCFPLTSVLSSCFSCVGAGFRLNMSSARVIDLRSWKSVSNSVGFQSVEHTCLSIRLGGLSNLQDMLASAVKPFLRIHVVHIETGAYLSSPGPRPTIVPPLSSRQAHLKGSIYDVPRWDEDIVIPHIEFKHIVHPDALILFEVLDDPPSLSFHSIQAANESSTDQGKRYTKLAWAFLLPVGQRVNVGYPKNVSGGSNGTNKTGLRARHERENDKPQDRVLDDSTHVDPAHYDLDLTLQLYAYQDDTLPTKVQRGVMGWPYALSGKDRKKTESPPRFPDSVPEVYMQYRRVSLQQIRTTLDVRVGYRPAFFRDLRSAETGGEGPSGPLNEDEPRVSQAMEDLAKSKLRAAIIKRSRAINEPCAIPNKVLHRLHVGHEGAMCVQFSNSGHLLAVACAVSTDQITAPPFAPVGLTSPFAGNPYAVKLFDPDTGLEIWSDVMAHHGVIYDLRWSADDCFILTCSSDGRCKVWQVGEMVHVTHSSPTENGRRPSSTHRRKSVTSGSQSYRPKLVSTMMHGPPVYVYAAVFQEYHGSRASKLHPRVLSGSHDGRIRVWDGNELLGDLTIGASGGRRSSTARRGSRDNGEPTLPGIYSNRPDPADVAHMGQMVQALAIDKRSKYLFSGDSEGNILIWRPDSSDWYQMLRTFKKDDLQGRSISSLSVFPNKAKGYLLVLALPGLHEAKAEGSESIHGGNASGLLEGTGVSVMTTSMLRVYDLGTYRAQHTFTGANVSGAFCRASFSADGRYAVSGCVAKTPDGAERFTVQMWDTVSGHSEHSDLTAKLSYPYIPRAISWHPHQHMVAVAMVGAEASLGIYIANKASAEVAARRFSQSTEAANSSHAHDDDDYSLAGAGGERKKSTKLTPSERLNMRMLSRSTRPKSSPGRAIDSGKGLMGSPRRHKSGESTDDAAIERLKEKKAARTAEILEKIKAAKARKQQAAGLSEVAKTPKRV